MTHRDSQTVDGERQPMKADVGEELSTNPVVQGLETRELPLEHPLNGQRVGEVVRRRDVTEEGAVRLKRRGQAASTAGSVWYGVKSAAGFTLAPLFDWILLDQDTLVLVNKHFSTLILKLIYPYLLILFLFYF